MSEPYLQATHLLEQVLAAGERALVRGSARIHKRRFTDPSSPYWAMETEARERFHGELRLAERAGAIELHWSRYGGESAMLEWIRLRDLGALARHLGQRTYASTMELARSAFAPWLAQVPRLNDVLARWTMGKQVRRQGPEAAEDFVDAARIIVRMANEPAELPVRVVSRHMFRDSKRIEALVPHLDVLTSELWPAPVNHREDVLSGIGLRKSPLSFHMAGVGSVDLSRSGPREVAYEYLAVSPTQVIGYKGRPHWLLSVENWTTFSMIAALDVAQYNGVVLYCGGMPSPSWRRAYAVVVSALEASVPVYHWGDMDVGGFRVSAVIAEAISPRALLPWCMDLSLVGELDPATTQMRSRMAYSAQRAGWAHLAAVISSMPPGRLEQEDLPIELPSAC